jgi:hypothetical protein
MMRGVGFVFADRNPSSGSHPSMRATSRASYARLFSHKGRR